MSGTHALSISSVCINVRFISLQSEGGVAFKWSKCMGDLAPKYNRDENTFHKATWRESLSDS